MGGLLKKYDNLDFLGAIIDAETMIKIATCEIDPISLRSLKEVVEERERLNRERVNTKTFFRRNKGPMGHTQAKPYEAPNAKLTKFFGIKRPTENIELGYSSEEDHHGITKGTP
jgi:hypothetical protein